jgi:hypothetical protein
MARVNDIKRSKTPKRKKYQRERTVKYREEHKDKYDKSKSFVFADAYGGEAEKLAQVTGLTKEKIIIAKANFQNKFSHIRSYMCQR